MTMIQAYAPNGARIVSTVEHVYGTCDIVGFERNAEGGYTHVHGDSGTYINWDASDTERRDGLCVYADEQGNEWTEDRLTFGKPPAAPLNGTPTKAETAMKQIASALHKLKEVRDLLVLAGAPNAANRVRAALKSAEGALRNASGKQVDELAGRKRIRRGAHP